MIVHGTLHVIFNDRRCLLVCADGRLSLLNGDVLSDDSQKLFQCGERTAVGVAGICSTLRPPGWADWIGKLLHRGDRGDGNAPGYSLADFAAICQDRRLHDNPTGILRDIRVRVSGKLAEAVAQQGCPDDHAFHAYAVKRRRGGAIELAHLQFPVSTDQSGHQGLGTAELKWPFASINARLMYTVGNSVKVGGELKVDGFSDSAILETVDRIFQDVRRENTSNDVGEATHVAAIEDDGFRWLRKR